MQVRIGSVKIFLLFLIVSCIPLQLTQAAVYVDTLYSYPEDVPVLDGVFEPEIWSFSRELQIKLYGYYNQESILILSLMAVYNEANASISFGVTIPDDTVGNDMFTIIFKTNATAPLFYNHGMWTFSDNHDAKMFYPDLNISDDRLTYSDVYGGPLDTDVGGINNLKGNGTHTGSQYHFELTTPLASGDTLGKDINLAKKDEIDFAIMYRDNGDIYSQIKTLDQDFEYCTLNVGKKGLLGPSPFYIVAALFITGYNFYNLKKKSNEKW